MSRWTSLVAGALLGAGAASAAPVQGVTDTEVTFGMAAPFTGPASPVAG